MTNCTCLYSNYPGGCSVESRDPKCPVHGETRADDFALWGGDYVKDFYLARVNGKEIPCWPNAGRMCATDGSGRTWRPEDGIEVRRCKWDEHALARKEIKK